MLTYTDGRDTENSSTDDCVPQAETKTEAPKVLRVKFEITDKDVTKALKLLKKQHGLVGKCCPMALALKRALGNGVKQLYVHSESTEVTYKSGDQWEAKNTKVMSKKIEKFDKKKQMCPGHHVLTLTKR